jgi:hypothetical protein
MGRTAVVSGWASCMVWIQVAMCIMGMFSMGMFSMRATMCVVVMGRVRMTMRI